MAQYPGHRRVGLRFLDAAAPPDRRVSEPRVQGIAHAGVERRLRVTRRTAGEHQPQPTNGPRQTMHASTLHRTANPASRKGKEEWVIDGIRTRNNQNHNLGLYH